MDIRNYTRLERGVGRINPVGIKFVAVLHKLNQTDAVRLTGLLTPVEVRVTQTRD